MTTKKREEELETITQEIARMREHIAALAATVQKRADAGEQGPDHEHEGWADIQQIFEEARARGEKALKDLAVEVERHPLRSIAAAVGVGFILAKLFGRGRAR